LIDEGVRKGGRTRCGVYSKSPDKIDSGIADVMETSLRRACDFTELSFLCDILAPDSSLFGFTFSSVLNAGAGRG
jgi:hypothetical protein